MKNILRIIRCEELVESDPDAAGYFVFYEDNTYIWVSEYDTEE